jgi:nitrogenase iron protein NifH
MIATLLPYQHKEKGITMAQHIAVYGKGGVGKTTLATNISAALAEAGFSILLVGCDPKGDTSALLNNGHPLPDVLGLMREQSTLSLDSVVHESFKGIRCVELGNPFQTGACASQESQRAFRELRRMELFERIESDYVIYDVTGDSSCTDLLGAIRNNGLDRLFVATSADYMSLHAANSIFTLMERYATSDAPLNIGGLIPNNITSSFEESFIKDFAKHTQTDIFGRIPRSLMVRQCELYGKTIIEAAPLSNQAYFYRRLANQIVDSTLSSQNWKTPRPMRPKRLRAWAQEWGDRIYALENGLVTDGEAI